MSDTVIRVEGIGKRYRVGQRQSYLALRDVLAGAFRRNGKRKPMDFIWAVRDVSFEVKQGEVVGLIGRNGAGKSTLLKLLARITRPTVGRAELHGRIGSLLEVGTGFHPELTGRENIFLSGAILGMSKAEILRKFDEIVAFSEVERFIDTPLKHYSSGMGMRLAFAVAAHLEPEILLVDEVLSVGDASFQKKCLGKMQEVSRAGRTILFVSHNLHAVSSLCSRCMLLETGRVVINGATEKATSIYHAQSAQTIWGKSDLRSAPRTGTGKAKFTCIAIQPVGSDGSPSEVAYTGCDLGIELTIEACEIISGANVSVILWDRSGYRLCDINIWKKDKLLELSPGGTARIRFRLHELLLRPGSYVIGLWIGRERVDAIDYIEQAGSIDIAPNPEDNKSPMEFSGPYLCRYDENVSILPPVETAGNVHFQVSDAKP